MDKNPKTTNDATQLNGIFVRGVVVSNTARVFNRKDGSGKVVSAQAEISLQPGIAIYDQFLEVDGTKVKVDGDTVTEFPKLPEFEPIELRVTNWAERDKRLIIRKAEIVIR